jgi:hypothetical protein
MGFFGFYIRMVNIGFAFAGINPSPTCFDALADAYASLALANINIIIIIIIIDSKKTLLMRAI